MRTGLQLLVEQARLWNLPATQPGELLASAPFIPVSEMGVWSFTPYVFCSFRCRYCCAQAQGLSRPIFDAEKLVETMRRELRAGRVASPIIIGLAADAYPPLEAELGLTRLAIRTLTEERTQFSIVTKGALIRRDIDLLAGNHFVQSVAVSISSHRDEDIQLHEPGAPSFGERSDAVFDLVKNGVPTQVHVVWIPGTTDVPAMARAFRGAAPIIVGPLNLDEDTHKPPERRSSALRAYGHMWTQDEIDEAYLAEAESHFDAAVWGYPVKPRAPCFSLMSREDLHHFRRPATLAAPDAHPGVHSPMRMAEGGSAAWAWKANLEVTVARRTQEDPTAKTCSPEDCCATELIACMPRSRTVFPEPCTWPRVATRREPGNCKHWHPRRACTGN